MARRLAAILVADVAGYSRLMHENEEATYATLRAAMSSHVVPAIRRHSGRVVKTTGDGFLAEFSSAVEAVRCALEFQEALVREAMPRPAQERLLFRVGIDVGDMIVEDNDIYGDHVNIASRLEQLAKPGGILISSDAQHYVQDRVTCRYHDLGERRVKNIARPVHIFQLLLAESDDRQVLSADELDAADQGSVSRLNLLGPVSLRVGRQDIRLRSLKARAILGYIALGESLHQTRERLVRLLWSEANEGRARAMLGQAVRELRGRLEAAGCPGIHFGPYEIGINPQAIQIDVFEVLKAAELDEAHPLLLERRHLLEELLVGLEDVDPAFRVWLLAKRNTLRDRLLFALESAMTARPAGSREESRLAMALINLDPTHEDACRRLMQGRASAGDMVGVLRIYNTLRDLLADEYSMEPSAATKSLLADLKTGVPASTPAPIVVADPQRASTGTARLTISLSPVAMHDVNPEKIHLVHGFRQHLIASLIRFREWQVTDTLPGDVAMGEAPGDRTSYELQMSVHQDGPVIHLLVMLKESESKQYVWSDRFELKLENWFEAQRQLVQRIALALNVHLSAERLRRLSEHPDVSLGIYDRWLRCQTLIRTFNLEHWEDASRQFLQIIEGAPNFVPAYCGLADMHNTEHIVYPGKPRTRERERQAIELARQAAELDPASMHAHRSLAWANAMAGRYTQAAMHIETAYELNPNDPWTHFAAALLFAFCGQTKRAAELVDLAREKALVPNKVQWAYLVDIHYLSGDYEAAVEASEHAQDGHRTARAWRAAALAQLGCTREAADEAAAFFELIRKQWFGVEPPTDEAILRWMMHLYPISRREDWERLRDGLRMAGMPVEGIEYRSW